MKFAIPFAVSALCCTTHVTFAQTTLEVEGKIQLYNDTTSSAEPGMIRWNEDEFDFEGFTGNGWVSLTMPEQIPLTVQIGCGPESSDTLLLDGMPILMGGDGEIIEGNEQLLTPYCACVSCIDHDGDGLVGLAEFGCSEACYELDCNDGIDNDGDGLIDSDDCDCTECNCSDGLDNDEDGLIDCEDPDCNEAAECGG